MIKTTRTLALLVLSLATFASRAASFAETVTPTNTSIEVQQSQVLTALFRDAARAPSPGENVLFTADGGCGVFGNGLSQQTVVTGAGGTASVTFTAGIETGITCVIRANAGAQTQFRVVTFSIDQVTILMDVMGVPNPPLAGRAFSAEVYVRIGNIELPNVTLSMQVINGSGKADLSSGNGNTAALSRLQLNVFPQAVTGDFQIEITFKTLTRRFPVSPGAIAASYQDMWWAGNAENGWGTSVLQHGDTIFAVLFIYADDGRPTWYVLPVGSWNAAHTVYTGDLYLPTGSPFFAYDVSRFNPGNPAGTLTLTFNDAGNAFLDYTIGSQSGTKGISRQPVGPVVANGRVNHGDMFYGGQSQNGWGVAILQQFDTLFIVWFTYDTNGKPTWYVMPSGSWTTATTYEGRLYRTTSSPWVGATYRASQLVVTDAGPYRLRFNSDGVPIALDYTVDARSGTLTLLRQGF